MNYQDDQHRTNNFTNQQEYDGEMRNFEQTNLTPPKQKKHYLGMIFSGIVGGVIVALVGVFLVTANIVPITNNSTNSTEDVNGLTGQTTSDSSSSTDAVPTVAGQEDNASISAAIQQSSPAVVGVKNIQESNLFTSSQQGGTGSGVIYKKKDGKAYIVTNNHVVDGAAELEVVLNDGEQVNAKILGTDALTDLAVLEIDGSNVDAKSVATFGSSSDLYVGESVIAIGNPLGLEFAGSVTKGIVSGLERSVEIDSNGDGQPDWTTNVIQTDAAINPGNSGGALVNAKGEVVGINSMKIAQEAVEGIGFSIPVDTAKPIIQQLETDGKISRPLIGIQAVSLSQVPAQGREQTLALPNDVTEGVAIANIEDGSPASEAGLQRYDVITKINDSSITSMIDLRNYLYKETEVGEEIDITYYREGKESTTTLTLSEK
ncbi:trypsin-like peptidase domain-containing protein [Aquibacillus sp. 3ASR75-11]|uniref:Trypsin-like peptidase domain-containing protein n=1 Tax=Terrihalobacillus insolitus TaxID=2950438 RepID=A0A9X3WT20_9BACI|nr:trypsin-like peptidase domain-containing protein [Terrihalobacillus insolitus]MDC3425180.1 trypsin-like peptidase domain-containing protein [Terrihalobacillus insolitus]